MIGNIGPYITVLVFLVFITCVGLVILFKFSSLHERANRQDNSLKDISKDLTEVAHGVESNSEASKEIARCMCRVEANVRDVKIILETQQRNEPRPV